MNDGRPASRPGSPRRFRSPLTGWIIVAVVFVLLVAALLVLNGMKSPPFTKTWYIVSSVDFGTLLAIVCGAVVAAGIKALRRRRKGTAIHREHE